VSLGYEGSFMTKVMIKKIFSQKHLEKNGFFAQKVRYFYAKNGHIN
jgi:hypothetical protein